MTDSTGTVRMRFEPDAWGNPLPTSFDTLPIGLAYLFVGAWGCRVDAQLGLIYMRQRWYDAALGRFVSRDPGEDSFHETENANGFDLAAVIPMPESIPFMPKQPLKRGMQFTGRPQPKPPAVMSKELNLYAYGLNNPVQHVDPSGRRVVWTPYLNPLCNYYAKTVVSGCDAAREGICETLYKTCQSVCLRPCH